MDDETSPKNKPITIEIVGIKILDTTTDASSTPLKPHETAHILVGQKDSTSGMIIIDHKLTTAKKNFITKEPNTVISDDNFKQTGKPQRMNTLETGRLVSTKDDGKTYVEHPQATAFLNDPEINAKVVTVIKTSPARHNTPRYTKDDSVHYTEDGCLINNDNNVNHAPLQTSTLTENNPIDEQKDEVK